MPAEQHANRPNPCEVSREEENNVCTWFYREFRLQASARSQISESKEVSAKQLLAFIQAAQQKCAYMRDAKIVAYDPKHTQPQPYKTLIIECDHSLGKNGQVCLCRQDSKWVIYYTVKAKNKVHTFQHSSQDESFGFTHSAPSPNIHANSRVKYRPW